jgi:hypothetical protein
MGMQVCAGAMLQCTFGVAPSSLVVTPQNRVLTSNLPAATIMDHKPMVNIPSFGMCTSIANPAVASATAAALGVLRRCRVCRSRRHLGRRAAPPY